MEGDSRARAEALLLKADRIYGVNFGKAGVTKALDHVEDGAPFESWVLHHLETDNLLTPDELEMYAALDRDGKVDALSGTHDLTQAQAVSEDEIRTAAEELRRSTDAIRKQTEILNIQRQALERSVQKRGSNDRRRQDLEIVQRRKWEIEHKQLSGEVESLSYSIEQRLNDLTEDIEMMLPRMHAAVGDSLKTDDKLLGSLQKLGQELGRHDPREAELIEKMREICLRLIKTAVETIRTRLDRVYLETLVGAAYHPQSAPPSSAEVKELGDEVESLYAEILPVAQMSVEQQRLDPAIKGISARDGHTLQRSGVALHYISDCLDHILAKLNYLSDRIGATKKHQAHSAHVTACAREELSAATSDPAPTPQEALPASPVRRPAPIRMRSNAAAAASRRRSSGIMDIPALETLMETLGVQLPVEQSADDDRFSLLGKVVEDRNGKSNDITKNAQDSYEAITTSHLDDLRTAVQLLNDSAFAEAAYGEVRYVDADFEASIHVLKTEVEQAKERLSRLEMKHTGKKSERKEDLVNRWTA
ncbi:hypothetical protein NLU13_2546 [Sarocladium strictum]|uniref:HAUS augmin-like complex subunit 3 N-terminal domain-containing protein n=1 Tax=Sarocladium strictum TaxID=5046 RepID=A0AA39L9M7_SARSR|nr:hypothetical protein NLU13_2546 [Sarocladium strictum]